MANVFPTMFWILVAVSAVLCCMGFYRFVWFMSVGYGLAVAGCGAAMAIADVMAGNVSPAYLVMNILIFAYGCRLGFFLLIRELKNAAYKKTLDSQTGKVPFFVAVIMWVCMAILYPIQVSPVLYRFINGRTGADMFLWAGSVIIALGIIIEALADQQKTAQKILRPNMAATEGLYKLCRCPNYFGEILVWTGIFVSGLNILQGAQWIISILGYVLIVAIMFSGAKRLEKRQNKNYGNDPEYRTYADTTPILIPFLPLYHMVKPDWK